MNCQCLLGFESETDSMSFPNVTIRQDESLEKFAYAHSMCVSKGFLVCFVRRNSLSLSLFRPVLSACTNYEAKHFFTQYLPQCNQERAQSETTSKSSRSDLPVSERPKKHNINIGRVKRGTSTRARSNLMDFCVKKSSMLGLKAARAFC